MEIVVLFALFCKRKNMKIKRWKGQIGKEKVMSRCNEHPNYDVECGLEG